MKWVQLCGESEVAQSCLTLCDPTDCSLPGSSVHGIFKAIVLEWIAISFSRGSSQPGDWTWVSRIVDRRFTIWATRESLKSESCSVMLDSLWPHGLYSPWNSPGQNTGAGSSSLLQGIFPIQGLNPGLPHCRQTLYHVSHQEASEQEHHVNSLHSNFHMNFTLEKKWP